MSTPFTVQQSENYEGENWWQWAVWLDGPEEELDKVESVESDSKIHRPGKHVQDRDCRLGRVSDSCNSQNE
jgi:hypothetical protein